jgi:hypothetical protein
LEPDGFGRNTVDNKLLEDITDTEPYKWTGTNPNIPTECGPRTEKYFWRSENYDNRMLTDLAVYVRSLAPRPNRWRQANGELTPAQERGKAIFERTVDKFKKAIVAPIATADPKARIRESSTWGRVSPTTIQDC